MLIVLTKLYLGKRCDIVHHVTYKLTKRRAICEHQLRQREVSDVVHQDCMKSAYVSLCK